MATDSPASCDQPDLADLLALYAVDALRERERAQVEAHVTICPTCQMQLVREQDVLTEVARLTPQLALPDGMRERTLARARELRAASSDADSTRTVADTLPPLSAALPLLPASLPNKPGIAERLAPIRQHPEHPVRTRWQTWALAAAAVLVLVLLPWNVVLHTQLAQQQTATQQAQQTQQALAAILAAPHLSIYALAGTRDATATGHVYIDAASGRVAIVASDLPQLDANRTYQAWLNHDGVRTSVGTFHSAQGSKVELIGLLPQRLSYYQSLGITVEPAGGSPHPTGPNVMLSFL